MATEVARLIATLEARQDKFEKEMRKAGRTAEQTFGKMEHRSSVASRRMEAEMLRSTSRMNKALASTSAQLGLFGKSFALGFIGGGSIAGFVSTVRGAISQMAKLGDVADKLGIGAEELQRLRYAFSQVGVAAGTTDMAMQRFSRRVGEAANGGGVLYKIFEANNIQLRDSNGKMRSHLSVLKDYANLVKNAASSQEQLMLSQKGFDSEGVALVSLLRQGADGIQKFMDKTEEAGGVINDQLVARAQELDLKWNDVWRNFEVNAKTAIMSVVDTMDFFSGKVDAVSNAIASIGNSSFFQWLSKKAGTDDVYFVPGEGIYRKGDKPTPSSRVAQAFLGDQPRNPELEAKLKERYGSTVNLPPVTVVPGSGGGGSGGSGSAKATLDAYESMSQRMKEATDRINAQTEAQAKLNPTVQDYGYTLQKVTAQQDLLNAAKRAGIEITPDLTANIEKLADGYAQAGADAARLAENQDEVRRRAEEMRDLGKDVMGGFIKDMRDGASASEALSNALQKVGDKLLDIALNSMFSGKGGLFGGGGGLFGGRIIPGLLHSGGVAGRDGYGHGRSVSPSVFAGAQRYHSGGVAGLKPGEVPAILQRGEVVLPKGGFAAAAQQGVHVTVGVSVDKNGNLLPFVESVSQRKAGQMSAAAIGQYDKGLPGRINDVMLRNG